VEKALSTALAHLGAGRLGEAEALCHAILERRPREVAALHCLGLAALQGGRPDRAVAFLGRAAALTPTDPAVLTNLGSARRAAGKLDEAVAAFSEALKIDPRAGETLFNLGNALRDQRRLAEAESTYRRAIAAGNCRQGGAAAYGNLGLLLEERGAIDEAIAAHRQAVQRRPEFAEYHYNLGNSLRAGRALDEAVGAYDRALTLRPNYPEARLNQSLVYLLKGDFARGLEGYESRLQTAEVEQRGFSTPVWRGEPLNGRCLLLHAEQGLGDTIQFLRYLPVLDTCGGRVVVEVQPALRKLVDAQIRHDALVSIEVRNRGEALPPFDCHLPFMSLAKVFSFDGAAIPAITPYLRPDSEGIARWQARLGAGDALRIGLVWAGNPHHRNDRNRSIQPAELLPLLDGSLFGQSGRQFFSLQVGAAAEGISVFPAGSITDLAPLLHDLAETAAALTALDLIITVDTSVAHLAGALGRPVELLLPYVPDWRWLLDRSDSPWYPTMHINRQKIAGDWKGVVASLAAEFRVGPVLSWARNGHGVMSGAGP
jgi:tetratricopeptide (TPR) repeat protein